MIYLVAMGFICALALKDTIIILCFSFCYSIYLFYRFKNKFIIFLFVLLSIYSILVSIDFCDEPISGEYTIVEMKSNYAIAKNNNCSILIQNSENLSYFDVIHISSFERIHTDDNFNLFSFTEYLNNKHIYYKAKEYTIISYSSAIKSLLYRWLSNRKNSSTLLSLYYQIHDDTIDSIFTSLGCGIVSCFYFLEKCLKKIFKENHVHLLLIVLLIIDGYLFTYSVALVRLILYQCFKSICTDRLRILGFTMLMFGILMPYEVASFGFVFPMVYSLANYFIHEHKFIVQKCILIGMMFMYFKKINLISLVLFGIIRKCYGILFIFGYFIELPKINLPSLEINYSPGVLFCACFIIFVYYSIKHFKKKYLFVFLIPFIEIYCNPFFQVYSINIGQGDCTLIVEPFRKSVVMIDCGQSLYRDNIETIVYPYLKSMNIYSLDCLILTHDDYDHNGGYEKLNECIEIKKVITDSNEEVPVSYPFYSLLPDRSYTESNDLSIVNYFSYDSFRFLWMGDASVNVESNLLNTYTLSCDFIKLGHHGSNTSSSFEFLNTIEPKLAIISCGYNNKYNHPHVEVVKRLKELGISSLSTKDCGSIGIYTLFNIAFFITQDGIFGIINKE